MTQTRIEFKSYQELSKMEMSEVLDLARPALIFLQDYLISSPENFNKRVLTYARDVFDVLSDHASDIGGDFLEVWRTLHEWSSGKHFDLQGVQHLIVQFDVIRGTQVLLPRKSKVLGRMK